MNSDLDTEKQVLEHEKWPGYAGAFWVFFIITATYFVYVICQTGGH